MNMHNLKLSGCHLEGSGERTEGTQGGGVEAGSDAFSIASQRDGEMRMA